MRCKHVPVNIISPTPWPHPRPLVTITVMFSSSVFGFVLLFPHIRDIIQYLMYITWHDILKVHLYCWKWQDFLFPQGWVVVHCWCIYVFIPLSVDGRFGCFHIFSIVNYNKHGSAPISLITCFYFLWSLRMTLIGIATCLHHAHPQPQGLGHVT